jgi:hypothetical protein
MENNSVSRLKILIHVKIFRLSQGLAGDATDAIIAAGTEIDVNKLFLTMAVIALALRPAFAANAAGFKPDLTGKDPHWIEDRVAHCWVGNPDPQVGESVSWSGACMAGLATGPGVVTWYRNGRVEGRDSGTYQGGILAGRGKISSANGTSFEGDFPGKGILTLSDGLKLPAQSILENGGYSVEQIPAGK